ncbi:MAG: cation-translocating P-type ATPase [Deltaproteobacteria bacterium]|nr:MAG: cation-translocating P-type ATPase [Deltaproteobacteria bacterium]
MSHGAASEPPPWHTLSPAETLDRLHAAPHGLTSAEAARRLEQYGPNELQAACRVSPWALLLSQLRNTMIVILLAAAAASALLGHGLEAAAIAVIVLFAVLLGFLQEFRAERALEALRQLTAPQATVLRDGTEQLVPARDVVPGDIVLLQAGDRIPADLRLLEAVNLQAEEAALTGESQPVAKQTAPLADAALTTGDRTNQAFAGTTVSYGRGRGVVVATAMATEFGRIARLLEAVAPRPTPLQQNLDRVGRLLARAALAVVAAIVLLGLWRGQPFIDMLIFGIALAVAVVPEALPAVVTISLAIGVQRMVRRHALMRRLPAVETLGSTSVICSDKTGTLTRDEMTARVVLAGGRELAVDGAGYEPVGTFRRDGAPVEPDGTFLRLLRAAALASDARLALDAATQRWQVKGDPTEGALVVAAAKAGLDKVQLDREFPRVAEIPFSAESKRMTTVHQSTAGLLACSKGAPEVLLAACTRIVTPDGEEELDAAGARAVLDRAREMAGRALRVLAVAERRCDSPDQAEQGLTLLGLVGMSDPPRPEAYQAVARCRAAGIRPVMITGDHPLTARAIALELGLLGGGRVVSGAELEAMSDEELQREAGGIEVYARVAPAHKLRVVHALQQRGEVVAMTGDGINDAPALKQADIGIAMGITGTDVSREAAAMTLTDDNFASIVAAVEEGRGIYGNIKKYLMYLLSSNIGEIGLMAGAALFGLPLPLTAVQILYVNLATDGLPALALAVDPPEPDLMSRPPRNPQRGIFTPPVLALMVTGGLWSTAVNLGLFVWALQSGRSPAEAMTMTFVSLVLIQFCKAYSFRSDHRSLLDRPFANRWLNLAILWEVALLLVIVYAPVLQAPFATFALTAADWVIVVLLAGTVVPALELAKWLVRRGVFGRTA